MTWVSEKNLKTLYFYSVCIHTYIIYMHAYVHTYYVHTRTYIHTYTRIHTHSYVHAYVHSYVRSYVRTYIHTNKQQSRLSEMLPIQKLGADWSQPCQRPRVRHWEVARSARNYSTQKFPEKIRDNVLLEARPGIHEYGGTTAVLL
jgi:hypothetical protein